MDISIHKELLPQGFPVVAYTPINIDKLEQELSFHSDRRFVQKLITGLREGFDIEIQQLPTQSYSCKNLLSAIRNPEIVSDLLPNELKKGYIIGPFDEPPFEIYWVIPLEIAERKYSKKTRLIIDLPAPHNSDTYLSFEHFD